MPPGGRNTSEARNPAVAFLQRFTDEVTNSFSLRGKKRFRGDESLSYSCGHLMIIPFRHLGRLQDLASDEKLELFNLLDISVKVLNEAMKPDGFNVA